jgi:iron-sulfur cluster repair protein YtfE (RIC family)
MSTEAPNVIDLLSSQHREVEALFAELEKAESGKKDIVTTLAQKLLAHMFVEQTIVYPAFANANEDSVHEGYEEHELARFALARVLGTRSNDATFDAKIKALRELIEHHVKEEENSMFPKARALGEARLVAIGREAKESFDRIVSSRPATLLRRAEKVALLKQAS